MRRTRAVTVAALAVALALTGPVFSAAAQIPVEPPPVQPGDRPSTAEAGTFPYQEPRQVGPAVRAESCVRAAPEGRLSLDAIPAPQERLRIGEAQEFATGRGQTVAVIDSGVNPHPRLADRLDDGGDYILGDTGLSDCEGHGTVVAGILAAAPDPDTGFVGVAPDARILSIRQSSSFYSVELAAADGEGTEDKFAGNTTSMARAIVRAVDTPGVSVVNISEAACFDAGVAGNPPDGDLQAAVEYAVDRDAVVVTAAANDQSGACQQNPDRSVSTIVSPAWFDRNVLTVGATTMATGGPADFSIRGPWVDVAAPGDSAVSLDPASGGLTGTLSNSDGERFPIAGTSFATPYVAGLAALVRERFPDLTALEVVDRIQRTAQHTAGPDGRDTALGFGVIDPVAALTDMPPGDPAAATPEPVAPARLQDFALPPQEDPARRVVALAGAGAGVAALGVTLLTVFTVKRYRRSKLADRPPG